MKKKIEIGLFLVLIFCFISFYFLIFNVLPASFSIIKGNESTIPLDFPFNLYIKGEENTNLELNGKVIGNDYFRLNSGSPLRIRGKNVGTASLDFKLFGWLPLRTIKVNVLPDIDVFPGGQAIGVLLRSKGVMVVGRSFVESSDGHRYYPAQEAGIEVGDVIIAVNGKEINDKVRLASIIRRTAEKGQSLNFKIKDRRGVIKNIRISPVKNKQGIYMIGLYVDDGVAGVGTLTFYEPESGEFGALGHEITEANTQTRIEVREGKIIEAQISGINSGKKGLPGEKLGTFFQTDNILGEIKDNNKFGIFGILNKKPVNPFFRKPIPVAPISQVKPGPAKIYTVVDGGKIEEFDINIDRVYRQSYPDSKGLIITITDPYLKKMTGGIIQGMSGSPIVQKNQLVGAITHVFVNEPTRGYGVFAEWMLLQTDIYSTARASNY
ncbi:MAG: stage sporulation protein [Halanaerobiales bacterium]|nr:stage sporulation protein [Halanaerobiales bacterium]